MPRYFTTAHFFVCMIAVLLLGIHHVYFFYGHFGIDDMQYALLANDLRHGIFDWTNHYSYRLTIVGLTALSYELLGVCDTASALPPLLMSAMLVLTMTWTLRRENIELLILTLGIYFSYIWNLFYSDKLMPDIYVSCFVFVAWALYYELSQIDAKRKTSVLLGVAVAISLFLAFLSKGTVILILPLLIVYSIWDVVVRRERLSFWLALALSNVIVYGAYFGLHWMWTGNAFSRFEAIRANSYFNPCSYDMLPLGDLVDRLTSGYAKLISESHLLVPFVICVAWLFSAKEKSSRGLFFTSTISVLALSGNFMTISMTSYNPMCLDVRHFLLFTPILAVCGAHLFAEMLLHKSRVFLLAVVFGLVAFVSSAWGTSQDAIYYGLLSVAILGVYTLDVSKYLRVYSLCLFLLLVYPNIQYSLYSKSLNYSGAKWEMQRLISGLDGDTDIYGSQVFVNLSKYLSGYEKQKVAQFKIIGKDSINQARKNFLVKNWYCDWHSELSESTVADWLDDKECRITSLESDYKTLSIYMIVNK